MRSRAFNRAEAPAYVLALILSADGSMSERALSMLGEFGAFDQLGVSRDRLLELAGDCTSRIGPGFCERSWLTEEDIAQTEAFIDGVRRPEDRLRVCRLACAAVEDAGLVTHGARLVLEHVMARWHIDPAAVSQVTL